MKFQDAFRANIANLPLISGFVDSCADRSGLDAHKKSGLLVVLEEVFVNISSYAYPDAEGWAWVRCECTADNFVLEISDSGVPFNIFSCPDPDTTLAVSDRAVGGLGGLLIRKLCDGVSYRREDGRNVLRMEFRRT